MINDAKKPEKTKKETNRLILFGCYTLLYYMLMASEKIAIRFFIPGTPFEWELGWLFPAFAGALISMGSNILLMQPL